MEKKILNFTPHPIVVVDAEGTQLKNFPSVGSIRLKAETQPTGESVEAVPFTRTVFGEPEGLPEQTEGVFLIVSQLVKTALPSRTDLVVPAEVVRDAEGKILGCRSLGV